MIDRMKLKTKTALLVIAALIGLIGVFVFSTFEMKSDLYNVRQKVIGAMEAALLQMAECVKAAEGAADSRWKVKGGAQSTLTSIRDVANATKEQSIAQKAEEIATMVDETTVVMHSTAETAAELEKIAGELTGPVSRFRG